MAKYFLDFLSDKANDDSQALCIQDVFYTYADLKSTTAAFVQKIESFGCRQKKIGIYLEDSINTYAALLAIWYTGNVYIPIHKSYPPSRIQKIIQTAGIELIFSSQDKIEGVPVGIEIINYDRMVGLTSHELQNPYSFQPDELVYVLFTSGSTGEPKGVQISYRNLFAFLENLPEMKMDFPTSAGFLQMFELTFDLSIVSILLPLMEGGTLYHVSSHTVKYLEIYRLLEEYPIHFAIIVPSVLAMLKPYFESIELPNLLAVGLSGEAVPLELTESWQQCCPNARFFNFYGPTECTIFCTYYEIPRSGIQAKNGIVSIGKTTLYSKSLCLNEDGARAELGEKSLLWIGGDQVSPGYINHELLNSSLFMDHEGERYYNTGDIVVRDENDMFYYLGRKDHQVKISGYRIELSEVEFNASNALNVKSVVLAVEDARSMQQLVLFVPKLSFSNHEVIEQLKSSLPEYMLPASVFQLEEFPLNDNGKLDRKQLKELYDRQK